MTYFLSACVLLVLALGFHAADAGRLKEDSFVNIRTNPGEQLVVFYRSSNPQSARVLKIAEKAAKKIAKKLPHVNFRKCDGDLPINKQEYDDAKFGDEPYVFTSTPEAGIEKFTLDITVDNLVRLVQSKYLDFDPKDVVQFTSEDDLFDRMDLSDNPRPQFVKCFEEWCAICKRLKKTFQRAATYFKGKVDFVEVECSKNDETTQFCTRNSVTGYPAFILLTGEKKIKFEDEEKSILTFEKFFAQHTSAVSVKDNVKDVERSQSDRKSEAKQKTTETKQESTKKAQASYTPKDEQVPEPEEADPYSSTQDLTSQLDSIAATVEDLWQKLGKLRTAVAQARANSAQRPSSKPVRQSSSKSHTSKAGSLSAKDLARLRDEL